ncbi:hypothetical protein JCM15519_18140 [Fundidesulfovibrio butyratiphilus]
MPPIDVIGLGQSRVPATDQARQALARASALCAGKRLLAWFPDHPARKLPLNAPLDAALDALADARDQGDRVCVLTGGDPLFYGLGARLLERFGPEALRFHPATTTLQAAAARLKIPWQDLPVVSLHGRQGPGPLLAALSRSGACAVYTDPANSPDVLAKLFLNQGMDAAELAVCEDLGEPHEQVRLLGAADAARMRFSSLNFVVALSGADAQASPRLGRPDDWYAHPRGLITKWPVRACALAALRLGPESVLWDVGAGCGSVALEACALVTHGQVFAVEKNPERISAIRENRQRAGAWHLRLVEGHAPEALADLPAPDRVFLGGSLAEGTDALEAACQALAPDGRLVVDTVLLGSLDAARTALARRGWPVEIVQIQASTGVELASDMQLKAHNPVFILAADKPGPFR